MIAVAPAPTSWTLGRRGLLGQHVEQALSTWTNVWRPEGQFDWTGPAITDHLSTAIDAFARQAAGGAWRIAWCAGAGVVATGAAQLNTESAVLESYLDALLAAVLDGRLADDGALFFASSAGALYAGSASAPFDERSRPRPLAPYGHAKLVQEDLVGRWSSRSGQPAVLGRIGNLYGPGQDLSKAQGLISQLCWTQIRQEVLTIYVPLSTTRDYIYAPDCGRVVAAALTSPPAGSSVKVISSQRPMSVGAVLGEFRRVLRRNPRISLRSSPRGQHQVRDLRLRSRSWPELDAKASTPFPVGLHATYHDLLRRFTSRT